MSIKTFSTSHSSQLIQLSLANHLKFQLAPAAFPWKQYPIDCLLPHYLFHKGLVQLLCLKAIHFFLGLTVFEGFFNFLSYQAIHQKQEQPKTNFLILNSASFFEKSLLYSKPHGVRVLLTLLINFFLLLIYYFSVYNS